MTKFGFAPACTGETKVFGSQRPGYPARRVGPEEIHDWIHFMRQKGIQRIVCLLPDDQLAYYARTSAGLLGTYTEHFGAAHILHEPVPDYHLCETEQLSKIVGFLDDAVSSREPTVVHCSGGIGRTGHVLAGWLIHSRGLTEAMAIAAVREQGRNPEEAVRVGGTARHELSRLLNSCRRPRSP